MLMVLVSPLTQLGTSFYRFREAPRVLVRRTLIMVMESFIVMRYLAMVCQSGNVKYLQIMIGID